LDDVKDMKLRRGDLYKLKLLRDLKVVSLNEDEGLGRVEMVFRLDGI
jgi:hypothetical protein